MMSPGQAGLPCSDGSVETRSCCRGVPSCPDTLHVGAQDACDKHTHSTLPAPLSKHVANGGHTTNPLHCEPTNNPESQDPSFEASEGRGQMAQADGEAAPQSKTHQVPPEPPRPLGTCAPSCPTQRSAPTLLFRLRYFL